MFYILVHGWAFTTAAKLSLLLLLLLLVVVLWLKAVFTPYLDLPYLPKSKTHRIHKNQPTVGKYTGPMDGMGKDIFCMPNVWVFDFLSAAQKQQRCTLRSPKFLGHHLGRFDTYRDASLVQLILTYPHMKPFYVGCPLLLPSIGIVWSCVARNSAGLSHHQEKKGPMSFGYLDGFGVSLPQDASGKWRFLRNSLLNM